MIDRPSLDAVLQPLTTARGLPNAHYVSAEVHAEECRRLLFDGWAGVGFASEIAEPGAVMPLELAGQPLLAVRNRAGAVKVYQNVCRHRGMVLVEEKKTLGGLIRCPYHSWSYSLDGDLVATPHVGGPGMNAHPCIDRGALGLIELPSAVWHDVIFVNVSGTAPAFAEHAAAAIARWREFEGRPFVCPGDDSRFDLDVACNWKLAVENYCESYHLPWVHPGLNSYSRLEDHYNIEAPGAFSGQGTRVYRQMACDAGRRFPDWPGLSERWETGAEYVALYPNVLFGVHRDHAFAIVLLPQGPGRTLERVALHYAEDRVAGAEFDDLRARNAEMWKQVFAEDVFVVEGMQKGRQAVHFDGGRFSPAMDAPTHCFHAWVAARLARPAAQAAE